MYLRPSCWCRRCPFFSSRASITRTDESLGGDVSLERISSAEARLPRAKSAFMISRSRRVRRSPSLFAICDRCRILPATFVASQVGWPGLPTQPTYRGLFQNDRHLRDAFRMAHDQRIGPFLPRPRRRFEEERARRDMIAIRDELVVDNGTERQPEQLHVFRAIALSEIRRDRVGLDCGVLQQLLDALDVLTDAALGGQGNLASLRGSQQNVLSLDDRVLCRRESGLDEEPARVVIALRVVVGGHDVNRLVAILDGRIAYLPVRGRKLFLLRRDGGHRQSGAAEYRREKKPGGTVKH